VRLIVLGFQPRRGPSPAGKSGPTGPENADDRIRNQIGHDKILRITETHPPLGHNPKSQCAGGVVTIVIGDSLAVGFGAAAHIETHARVSASSCAIASFAPSGPADVIVVSAGINDPPGRCLDSLRARLHARRIIWILPAPINSARAHVAAVAAAHGDTTCSYVTGPRSFHPRSYAALVRSCLGRP
jgi:hypothetical protein